jgi:RimJ/RimL family protein N-acetyltransferase
MGSVSLRPALAQDADLLLCWRNDPETVRYSRSGRAVAPQEHANWITASLEDPSARIWIAEVNGEPVGEVRLNLSEMGWEVDLSVDPSQRGQGFGAAILRSVQAQAEHLAPAGTLWADVMVENDRSLRAFESVGFEATGSRGQLETLTWRW